MQKKLFFLSVLAVILLPVAGYSATWEIITHGGFDAAVSAWKKVALIFSDKNYAGLFLSAAVLGALVLYLATYVKIATGTKAPVQSWFTSFMLGLILYAAFVVPKDSVVIYDETLNRGPVQIDGIPKIVATIAGLLNKVEKGFTDIVATSVDPDSDYRLNAGGISYSVAGKLWNGIAALPVSYMSTLKNYIKDCVFVELQRPGTALSVDAIQKGTQKMSFVIRQSENPSLYTVSYLSSTAGVEKTCQEVGEDLLNWVATTSNTEPVLKTACAVAGYNVGTVGYQQCVNVTQSAVNKITKGDISTLLGLDSMVAQVMLAQSLYDMVTYANPDIAMKAYATSQTMSQFIGLGVHAGAWIPVIKETMSAIAVGLTPFFILLLITPLAGRALSVLAGMFVWITVWGIVDAVIHSFGVDYAQMAAEGLQASTGGAGGIYAMMMFPDFTTKIAAAFGAIRWAGLMLSSVITGMFLKFGGTALAMLAGSIASMPQSSGASAGAIIRNQESVVRGDIMPMASIGGTRAELAEAGGITGYAQAMTKRGILTGAGHRAYTQFSDSQLRLAGAGQVISSVAQGAATGAVAAEVGVDRFIQSLTNQKRVDFAKGDVVFQRLQTALSQILRRPVSAQETANFAALGVNISPTPDGQGSILKNAYGANYYFSPDGTYYPVEWNAPVKGAVKEAVTYKAAAEGVLRNEAAKQYAYEKLHKAFFGKTSEISDTTRNTLTERFSHEMQEALEKNKALAEKLGITDTKRASFELKEGAKGETGVEIAGTGVKAYVNVETGQARIINTTTGVERTVTLNDKELESFRHAKEKALEHSIAYTLSTRSGYEDVTNRAIKENATVAKVFQESYSVAKTKTEELSSEMTDALINRYTLAKYGSLDAYAVSRTIDDLSRMRATGDYSEFYKTVGIDHIDPKQIEAKLAEIKQRTFKDIQNIQQKVGNVPGASGGLLPPPPGLEKPSGDPVAEKPDFDKRKQEEVNKVETNFNKEFKTYDTASPILVLSGPVRLHKPTVFDEPETLKLKRDGRDLSNETLIHGGP